MKEETHVAERNISRRSFLSVAAATGAILAGCSSGAPSTQTQTGDLPATGNEEQWDGEADVIVVGFGGAGAAAALEAGRQGANVLIVEKAPEEEAGGNSSVCEGGALVAADRKGAFDAIRRTTTPQTVSDAELNTFLDNNMGMEQWFKDATGVEMSYLDLGDGFNWGNLDLGKAFTRLVQVPTFFATLKQTIEGMKDRIEIMYETPAVDLVIEHTTNEIRGVVVANSSGERARYKALRGVIMACGSFENNKKMIETYCYDPLPEVYPLGTPHNTGDGIPMVQKAGAQLRHMAELEWGAYCFRTASQETGATIAMNNHFDDLDHLIAVNKKGERFMNEALTTQTVMNPHPCHDKETMRELHYDGLNFEYDNLPFWLIFDDERFKSHALATWAMADASSGWTKRHSLYAWSDDNQAELEKGWIKSADTVADLAEIIGVDAAALEATVAAYNEACESGGDAFGRDKNLTPILTPPFYATDMALAFVNANGGPVRNERYEVLDYSDEPIPRLFAVGEFGSLWGRDYHGALNIAECLASYGAGANAAALDPWE